MEPKLTPENSRAPEVEQGPLPSYAGKDSMSARELHTLDRHTMAKMRFDSDATYQNDEDGGQQLGTVPGAQMQSQATNTDDPRWRQLNSPAGGQGRRPQDAPSTSTQHHPSQPTNPSFEMSQHRGFGTFSSVSPPGPAHVSVHQSSITSRSERSERMPTYASTTEGGYHVGATVATSRPVTGESARPVMWLVPRLPPP
jgi:hypothetical protein